MGNTGFETFRFEYFFLLDEDLLEVNLVYFLVCKIDTELFETVFLEHFKTVNVEKLDFIAFRMRLIVLSFIHIEVEFFDNPGKESFINGLGHGVSTLLALLGSQGNVHQFSCNYLFVENQPSLNLFFLDS